MYIVVIIMGEDFHVKRFQWCLFVFGDLGFGLQRLCDNAIDGTRQGSYYMRRKSHCFKAKSQRIWEKDKRKRQKGPFILT